MSDASLDGANVIAVLEEARGDVSRNLRLAPVTTIGRSLANTFYVDDPAMSRRHAEITRLPNGQHEIVDLDSKLGVYIGGERTRRRILADGDEIVLGSTRFTYRVVTGVDAGRDKRWAERFPCSFPVRLRLSSGRVLACTATNISTMGMELQLSESVTCDTLVRLSIRFPGKLLPVRLSARVVEETPRRRAVGLAFVFTSRRARYQIARQVALLMTSGGD